MASFRSAKLSDIVQIRKIENEYYMGFGISGTFQKADILQKLVEYVIKKVKSGGCEAIIWLTGSKSKHDKIETEILRVNGFEKKETVKHWEAYPNYFVDDHCLWIKEL